MCNNIQHKHVNVNLQGEQAAASTVGHSVGQLMSAQGKQHHLPLDAVILLGLK